MTAMSQRLTQQLGPVEDVADLPAKRIIVHIQKNPAISIPDLDNFYPGIYPNRRALRLFGLFNR
jgi:hypothetical protein